MAHRRAALEQMTSFWTAEYALHLFCARLSGLITSSLKAGPVIALEH
jgi:hypothetical protein